MTRRACVHCDGTDYQPDCERGQCAWEFMHQHDLRQTPREVEVSAPPMPETPMVQP